MSQVNQIYKYEEYQTALQNADSSNRFENCEEIVDAIVSKGLLNSQSISNCIVRVAREYNLSYAEAKTCVKLASAQVEAETTEKKEESLYAQSGYFYPSAAQTNNRKTKNDGMDSLSSYASYNRLMFGLS